MALIVEDGTGLTTAESYISVANADTYHTNRGNTAWTGTDAVKEAALRRATDYMLQAYRMRWKGTRMTATQALDWPRASVYLEPVVTGANEEYPNLVADDIVPTEVARACAELALRSLSGSLLADESQRVVREKIGPIETEYAEYGAQTKKYPAIASMLAPYFQYASGTVTAIRR